MKDYSKYDAIGFAQDEDFLKWVKFPGQFPERDLFWNNWVINNPQSSSQINQAKEMILTLIKENDEYPHDKIKEQIWVRLKKSIQTQEQTKMRSLNQSVYRIAAGFIFILSVSGMIWWVVRDNSISGRPNVTTIAADVIEKINNGKKPMTVVLSDGSSIVLQPLGKISYPIMFHDNFREVRLSGEAFFEVAKNPNKPFIVRADKLITRVLGTSFSIRALNDLSDVLVQVKTGKVAVFRDDIKIQKLDSLQNAINLDPNQQVIFSRKELTFEKSLVEDPDILDSSKKQQFIFRDAPLIEVFEKLEEVYGIQIIYDKEAIKNCSLNASLDDLPLYDKMRLICKGLNANYQIIDSQIIFSSRGCK